MIYISGSFPQLDSLTFLKMYFELFNYWIPPVHPHTLPQQSIKGQKVLLCYSTLINNEVFHFPSLFYAFFTCIRTPLCWWDVKTQLGSSYLCYISYYYGPVTHFQTPVFKRGCVWQFSTQWLLGVFYHPWALLSLGAGRRGTSPLCNSMVPYNSDFWPRVLVPKWVPQQLTGTVYRGSGEARCLQEITVALSTLGSWSPCQHLTNSC